MTGDEKQKTALLREALECVTGSSPADCLDKAVVTFLLGEPVPEELLTAASNCTDSKTVSFNGLLTSAAVLAAESLACQAHRCLIEASRIDDRSARPLLALAALYMKGGRQALAQRAYERAVALEPDLPEAWMGQGLLNELQGGPVREAEARMLYASVAAVRADLQEANLGLGRTSLSDLPFQAEMGLLRALDRDPFNADAQFMLALAYEKQGRLENGAGLACKDCHSAVYFLFIIIFYIFFIFVFCCYEWGRMVS